MKKYQSMQIEGISLEKLKDISALMNKQDGISQAVAVGLTKSVMGDYSLVNNSVALSFAKAFKKAYDDYKSSASDIIVGCMFENIGGKNYAVGVNTFLTRLRNKLGDFE